MVLHAPKITNFGDCDKKRIPLQCYRMFAIRSFVLFALRYLVSFAICYLVLHAQIT